MSTRSYAKLQRQVAEVFANWQDPHGRGSLNENGDLKGIEISESGQIRMAINPAHPHCPCCLIDFRDLRITLLKNKRINSVEINIIGIPANNRWANAINE
ncbi:MAG: hypothetical protein HOE92_01475 [Euryarchaeota archaeon]|jgi:hypothetical protein|nr:hypothetical protein [Euryarchaeota archaeon]MBT3970868.1 hypothetical protein [Euryarchaeota archaeon]MBT4407869.1 hypothetical protein [Euryarchaeota archaeon]MBT6645652.1 hypothetical protein [Euryarchaeota archaeon]